MFEAGDFVYLDIDETSIFYVVSMVSNDLFKGLVIVPGKRYITIFYEHLCTRCRFKKICSPELIEKYQKILHNFNKIRVFE